MKEIIEIKRKKFEVEETLAEGKLKVTRKGKTFILYNFEDYETFDTFVENTNKLNNNGIKAPKLYVYDKKSYQVVTEFIEGKTVFELLLEKDLSESIFEQVFYMNWFMKSANIALEFDPNNFVFSNKGVLYYTNVFKIKKYEPSMSFEKKSIFLWFYGKDFVEYLNNKGMQPDMNRYRPDKQSELNKDVALTVVKFYH